MKQILIKICSTLLASLMLAAFGFVAAADEEDGDLGASLDAFIEEHESTTAGLAVSVFTADETDNITMEGPAVTVFSGEVAL